MSNTWMKLRDNRDLIRSRKGVKTAAMVQTCPRLFIFREGTHASPKGSRENKRASSEKKKVPLFDINLVLLSCDILISCLILTYSLYL